MAELQRVYNNPPREFIDNRNDSSLLPSPSGELEFDPIADKYGKRDDITRGNMYVQAEAEKVNLLDAMEKFCESVGKHTRITIDTSKYQTWDEVEETMKLVSEEFSTSSGKRAAIRRFFDRLGDNGSTFSAWLGLLPDGEYSSIVCGAFKLIIKAAIGIRAIRKAVFEALGSIPTTLANAKLYFEMWKSLRLHVEFSKLYTAILEVFRHILLWLMENSFKAAAKAFLQQDGYEKSLTSKLTTEERCAASVREEASICSQYALGSVNKNMERQTYQLKGMKVTVEGMKDGVDKLGDSMDYLKLSQSRTEKSQARIEDRLNSFYMLFCDNYKEFKGGLMVKEGQEIPPRVGENKTVPKISPKKLRRILGHDPDLAHRDIQKTIAEGRAFNLALQERAEHLMGGAEFKKWFTARHSRVMLVNGNSDDERISPMSFACGLLANSLLSYRGPITLAFFCGLHTSSRDAENGPRPLAASLICQLLKQYQAFDLSFLIPEQQPALESYEIDTLCDLFVTLVQQLPPDQVLFCIIDGISFYESGDKRNDTTKIIKAIAKLVEDEDAQAVVKFLVVSPSISRWSTKSLARRDVYNLPETIELTNQGFDGAGFVSVARGQIEDLEEAVYKEAHSGEWDVSSEESETESDQEVNEQGLGRRVL